MSFVMFAGCKYFGYMIGDRRCCNKNGEVISENVEKVRKINQSLIYAAAGDEDMISLVYEYLNKHKDISFDEAIVFLNNNYHLIYNRLLELIANQNSDRDTNVDANIGLMSISNNIIMFASIHLLNEEIEIKVVPHETDDDITLCFFGVGLGSLGEYFNKLFYKNKKGLFTISNLKSIFYQTLKDNIQSDFTINNQFISESIIRKDIYDERKERPK